MVLGVAAVVTAMTPRGDDRSLPVPGPGEVAAGWVEQHPVFVVHDLDGSVRVLDGVSPHDPVPKVLAFCETSQWFEDLWHGSRFDRDGRWLAGPAPTGMAQYEVVARERGRVRVGSRQPPPPRWSAAGGTTSTPSGRTCDDRTALYLPGHPADPGVLDSLVLHDPGTAAVDAELWFPTPARILGQDPAHP
jgi:nitrite reductase/ring-hydroxylating ferredoxin subunit